MKQQKVESYAPRFPRKALKGAVLTAAAAIALGTAGGCNFGGVPALPDPVELDGAIAIEEPTDEPMTTGMMPIPTDTPDPGEEEALTLMGDVMVLPEEP